MAPVIVTDQPTEETTQTKALNHLESVLPTIQELPARGETVMFPLVPDLTPSQSLIQKALAVWKERGWTSGYVVNTKGQVCALGALDFARWGQAASCNEDRYEEPYRTAMKRIVKVIKRRKLLYHGGKSDTDVIINYNDSKAYKVNGSSAIEMQSVFEEAMQGPDITE